MKKSNNLNCGCIQKDQNFQKDQPLKRLFNFLSIFGVILLKKRDKNSALEKIHNDGLIQIVRNFDIFLKRGVFSNHLKFSV
jgi:hypothetical protein